MLQDLPGGRLLNEFRNPVPKPEDVVVCFRDNQVLVYRDEDNSLRLPTAGEFDIDTGNAWGERPLQYASGCRSEISICFWGMPKPSGRIWKSRYGPCGSCKAKRCALR